jgi:sporulation protein YlmC with PRC-barrel domain
MLTKFVLAVAIAAATVGFAHAQEIPMTTGVAPGEQVTALRSLPMDVTTVTNFYKQNVYDMSEQKIGQISDVLVDKDGKIKAFIISVGGFLGIAEKNVAVPFDAVHASQKNGEWWLTMTTTKDALKGAAGYVYDREKATWKPA